VPSWTVEGYSTIFWEVDDELARLGESPPTVVAVQIGVGSLAAAVVRHYHNSGATIVGVEPQTSPSLLYSARKGSLETLRPRRDSIMTGLNCGVPSPLAWPILRGGIDVFVAVEDGAAMQAVDLLAKMGLQIGETGAAGLAGLTQLLNGTGSRQTRRNLRIESDSAVLLLFTEGATDP
jgi:diaminopropionate ammonia-lyase